MSLTDEQRREYNAAMCSYWAERDPALAPSEHAFLAGIAWGAADMRERAAKVCDAAERRLLGEYALDRIVLRACNETAANCAAAIRALPGEAP